MKTIFNEIFKTIIDFCAITPADIEIEFPHNIGNEDTIRAWRSRGLPSRSNFDYLLCAIERVLESNRHKVERCKKQQSALREELNPIWKKYNADVVIWEESKSVIENLQEIITAAYECSKRNVIKGPVYEPSPVKRVVAFDLDGTLIKGFRYSWTIVFKAIGSSGQEAVKFKNDFEDGKISYPEWCKSDCSILRANGLTFNKVKKAVQESGASLTNNLITAIEKLKAHGHKVAIISGGADSVLYSLLPNADELFDEIYINRLKYNNETGILEEIIPTKYDWDTYGNGVEGKQAGLIRLCERYGMKPEESVFVGDDYNDVGAMAIAGMKIFYYTPTQNDPARGLNRRPDIRALPVDVIYEPSNDLLRVADRIISWDFGDMDFID